MLNQMVNTEPVKEEENQNSPAIGLTVRSRIPLDGMWSFWTDPEATLCPASLPMDHSLEIRVPAPWQPQSPELNDYAGAAWYQRIIQIPAEWLKKVAIILGIDAADYFTSAWLNGEKVGDHEGGYLPFEFDVSAAAHPGLNILTIRVDDPPRIFSEIPHGKQGWYGPLSGLWQSVWIERRSALHIQDLQLFANPDEGCVEVSVKLSQPVDENSYLIVDILDPSGQSSAWTKMELQYGQQGAQLGLSISDPLPWSPETPHLYRVDVQLLNGPETADRQTKNFGFRKIETQEGKLYLNGQYLYLRGALDQDYYLDSVYTTPSLEFLEDQLRKAKELGLNCLRCHIKVADPRYYDVADRMGMLIWTELPNWSVLTEDSGQRGREMMMEILKRDGHHPSIIIWTILNENWGTDLVNEAYDRDWLKDTYAWLKALDPTRLVVDNSPCLPNFHLQTDLDDFHFYRAIPDQRLEWDQFVKDFARRPAWTFSPFDDFTRTGQEPLIVSEFGNWGLPDADGLANLQGQDPWWFETGIEWSHGVVFPQGVRRRFRSLGLERPFGSWQKFVEATQWQQYLALKYEIEAMRRQPEISGYVITELTDVHWECNGLLDMRRKPKAFHEALKNINADTVIIPVWERVAYWSGEHVEIGLQIAHSGRGPLEPSELCWSFGTGLAGRVAVPALQSGQVEVIENLVFQAPLVAAPEVRRLSFEVTSTTGERVTANYLDLSLYPPRQAPGTPGSKLTRKPVLYCEDKRLARRLRALGYMLTVDIKEADLTVIGKPDVRLLAHLRSGGRLLVLADRAGSSGQLLPGIRVESRQGTPWIGDWASAFSWVSRLDAFSGLPGGPMVDHSFDRVIPQTVLTGFRDWDYRSLVHAGIVVGWVHKPAVLIGERFYGKGKAVLNTFHLDDQALGNDPTATTLFDGLVALSLT